MLITKEIKLQIACQYSNQKMWVTRYTPREFSVLDMLPEMIDENKDYDGLNIDKYKLLLKSLSNIDKNDFMFIVSKLQDNNREISFDEVMKDLDNDMSKMTDVFTDVNFKIAENDLSPIIIHEIQQYLIYQGYALPNFLLNGQTAIEAGIAIDVARHIS